MAANNMRKGQPDSPARSEHGATGFPDLIYQVRGRKDRQRLRTQLTARAELYLVRKLRLSLAEGCEASMADMRYAFSDIGVYLEYRLADLAREGGLQRSEDELRQSYLEDQQQPEEGCPQTTNRQAFVQMRERLLAEFRDMFVGFARGKLVAADQSFRSLMAQLRHLDPRVRVYVERVTQTAFREPPPIEMPGIHEAQRAGGDSW